MDAPSKFRVHIGDRRQVSLPKGPAIMPSPTSIQWESSSYPLYASSPKHCRLDEDQALTILEPRARGEQAFSISTACHDTV